MTAAATTNAIRAALRSMAAAADAEWPDAAAGLLAALGYRSERTLDGQSGDPDDFVRLYPAANPGVQSERALLDAAQSVHILFQYTASEIQAQTQRALFDAAGFDTGNARSFLFAAVQLRGDAYARGQYAAFTRELNKRFPMPMVVVFRTAGGRVTLAFVYRRPNKRDPGRDVLGSVSLIREIDAADPHRAHLDILAELSLDARLKWLDHHGQPHNFDGLLDAWLDALDTEALNRRFYRELFDWFQHAVVTARFPTDQRVTVSAEEHVIRLITRLLFVWFIKEKGLVAEELFVENLVGQLLQDYDADAGDSYYRAVLQNLFFATLNTEIAERGFSAERDSTHRLFSRYRYRKEMADPDALLALFAKTPFINGGLFDCLDSFDGTRAGGVRIDCFTDNPRQRAGYSIPNRLFFGQDAGGANPGLVTLFNRYKFTVEENTPAEREVALDPELLGKVFENLLAAFNPETRENARKQTGSYYTPRAVVDYMVDEALVATLTQKLSAHPTVAQTSSSDPVARTFLSVHPPQTGMSAAPSGEVTMTRRNLPHWAMAGAIYWVTFRLADAIPQDLLRALQQERDEWESRNPKPWSPQQQQTYDARFGDQIQEWLDAGYGSRALARPDIRQTLVDALLRFDGDRHHLHGAVIMPTHVHLLIEPLPGHQLSALIQGIKGGSARAANRLLGARGAFWLSEYYDHIVRDESEYLRFQQYIADNPSKAGLDDNEYWLYQPAPAPGGMDIPVSAFPGRFADRNVRATGEGDLSQRLRHLLDYDVADAAALFTDSERAAIVRAIAEIKVLDPAVGSGAFPMGVLHKLTLALRRLDPRNELWESLQKELAGQRAASAFDTADQSERDAELREISATFERYRDTDFGRKLYLIQNGIYGVDIQPIATQIAKLRFFISLAIDQEPAVDAPDADADGDGDADTAAADNYGIKPLPNLETRFVAANTLLGIGQPAQPALTQANNIAELHGQIRANRERHFHATTRRQKSDYRRRDRELRRELATALRESGFAAESARQLADWDPYDQNASADWFDAEYMFGVSDGFDVVIGNPPYVRQEDISPGKAALVKQYADAVTARSDLYCYFYARGLQLLADGGMHVFVCSNSWLDVGYGARLQEHLLDTAHVQAIYESAVERQFATADINTIISVIRKGGPIADGDATRFVSLRADFETAMDVPALRREIIQTRARLREDGLAPPDSKGRRKFVGDKWGGKYLRAPDIYHDILDRYGDKLMRLGDVATVRFGIKTGANDFFYLTPEVIAEFGIEAKYRRPVMVSPTESRRIAVDSAGLRNQIFLCHQDKADLVGTNALAYIEWGEEQEYHTRSSVKSRKRWYDLGESLDTKLAFGCRVNTTSRTLLAQDSLHFDKSFYRVSSLTASTLELCALLNSTLTQLMINVEGRANLGGGLLEIEIYETQNMRVVNPQLLPEPNESVFNAADWDVLTPSAARRHIDAAVFDALGLTPTERQAVYAGVTELVQNRRQRARSVSGPASNAAADKPPFKLVPHRGGFVPGVTADNLKDIIFDLEDEEFMEKLGL